MMNAALPIVLMRHASGEIVTVEQAMFQTGKSESTIRRLCRKHGLARQACRTGPLEISRVGLEMALYRDLAALDLLRAGNRQAPEVRRYLDHLGIAV